MEEEVVDISAPPANVFQQNRLTIAVRASRLCITHTNPHSFTATRCSVAELLLPTHAVAGGLYLSHMAVQVAARRRGVARALPSQVCASVRSDHGGLSASHRVEGGERGRAAGCSL